VVPFNVIDDGTVHVGRLCGLESDVVTEQERFTCPVSPPDGMIEIFEVFPVAAPAETLSGPLFMTARDGDAEGATVTWKVFVKLTPSVVLSEPLIFAVYVPADADPLIDTIVSTGKETGTCVSGIQQDNEFGEGVT
jgi:hypothetical protein